MAEQQMPDEQGGRPVPYSWQEGAEEEALEQGGAPDKELVEPKADAPAPHRHPAKQRPQQPLTKGTVALYILVILAVVSSITVVTRYNWPGVIVAVTCAIAAGLVGLRIKRGSRIEAEAKFRKKMADRPIVPDKLDAILGPSERVYVIQHEHPLTMTWWISVVVATNCLIGYWIAASDIDSTSAGRLVAGGLWLAAMVVPVYKLIEWRRTLFVITSKNIVLFTGVFTTKHKRMPLAALTDAAATYPWHGKLLAGLRIVGTRYGTFTLESAGQDQAINAVGLMAGIETLEYILMALVQGDDPYPIELDLSELPDPPHYDDEGGAYPPPY